MDRAAGFFFNFWKRIQKKEYSQTESIVVELGQSHLLVLGVGKETAKPEVCHFLLEPRPLTAEAVSERLRAIFKEKIIRFKVIGLMASLFNFFEDGMGCVTIPVLDLFHNIHDEGNLEPLTLFGVVFHRNWAKMSY